MSETFNFSFDKSNLQHIEDSHLTELSNFESQVNNPSLNDKVVEDQFWALCAEGDDNKIKQAIALFKSSREDYYKKEIEDALLNDKRFAHFVEIETA